MFHQASAKIRDVVFVNGGVASVTTLMKDGQMVETATVGDEGVLGVEVFFGAEKSSGETMMQVPDTNAEFLPAVVFKEELARHGRLFDSVQRYSQGLFMLMMQSTACMAHHEVQERCCRWLLMTHDRVRKDEFHLSHEFLSMMLGTSRPTVSIVAGTLQKAGLITYKHGRISIVDREALEEASCECYATIKGHFDRLGL